jgi:hypothetical protein
MKCKLLGVAEDRFTTVRNVIDVFWGLGFPIKKLWYYLQKWSNAGFYDYGVADDLGWFEPDKLTGEYKVMYENIVRNGGA